MTVNVSKPALNVREKLAELDKPTGIAGEAMLRAETPQEQFNLIGAGRRNLIINGSQIVDQRGGSTGDNTFGIDRWKITDNTDGVLTMSRGTDGPSTKDGNFKYYLQMNVDTADTAMAATQYAGAFYKIEGYDFDHVGYGTSNARTMTLSFYHAHSKAGVYCVALRNDGGGSNRNFIVEYTQDEPNVWQKSTVTIAGDTTGSWTGTTSAALSLMFTFCQGTGYATNTVHQWFGGTYYHASNNIVNLMDTVNAKFRLTGVQLEVGKVATPFEHRSYGEELALCQRYTYVIDGPTAGDRVGQAFISAARTAIVNINFPVVMRAKPTLEGTASQVTINDNTAADNSTSIALNGANKQYATLSVTTGSDMNTYRGAQAYFTSTADNKISFKAEL